MWESYLRNEQPVDFSDIQVSNDLDDLVGFLNDGSDFSLVEFVNNFDYSIPPY